MFPKLLVVCCLLAPGLAFLTPAAAAPSPDVECGESDLVDHQDPTRLQNLECDANWQLNPGTPAVFASTACPTDPATGGRACVVTYCTTFPPSPPACDSRPFALPPACEKVEATPHANGSVELSATHAPTGYECARASTPAAACTQPVVEPGPGDYRVGLEDPSGAEGCPVVEQKTCSSPGPHVEEDRVDVTVPRTTSSGRCWVLETSRPPIYPGEACLDQQPYIQPGIWPIFISFRSYYGECYRWYIFNPYYTE